MNPESKSNPLLGYVVAALGVLAFLAGFLPFGRVTGLEGLTSDATVNFFEGGAAGTLALLLLGGMLAAFSVLPNQDWMGAAAAASISGFVGLSAQSFNVVGGFYERAFGLYLVLVLGLVQASLAVYAVFAAAGPIAVGRRTAGRQPAPPSYPAAGYPIGPPRYPLYPGTPYGQAPPEYPPTPAVDPYGSYSAGPYPTELGTDRAGYIGTPDEAPTERYPGPLVPPIDQPGPVLPPPSTGEGGHPRDGGRQH